MPTAESPRSSQRPANRSRTATRLLENTPHWLIIHSLRDWSSRRIVKMVCAFVCSRQLALFPHTHPNQFKQWRSWSILTKIKPNVNYKMLIPTPRFFTKIFIFTLPWSGPITMRQVFIKLWNATRDFAWNIEFSDSYKHSIALNKSNNVFPVKNSAKPKIQLQLQKRPQSITCVN